MSPQDMISSGCIFWDVQYCRILESRGISKLRWLERCKLFELRVPELMVMQERQNLETRMTSFREQKRGGLEVWRGSS